MKYVTEPYALVRAESTPLASDPMLLPSTRYVPYTTTAMAARMSAYSVIVWPRVLRTTDSRALINIFVTDFILRISFYPPLEPLKLAYLLNLVYNLFYYPIIL